MVMFQMIINIGMCLFIMPVIGLTLPFFSYGGSSVVTLFAAMGFVSGIKKRTVVRRRPGRPLGSKLRYIDGNPGRVALRFFPVGPCSHIFPAGFGRTLPLYQYGISELTGG